MAARLVQRSGCCLLALSAPLLTPGNLLSAVGKRVIASAPAQLVSLASLHTSSPLQQTDRLSVMEQQPCTRTPEHEKVAELIETASTPEELLERSKDLCMNGNQTTLIISKLSRLVTEKKQNPKNILTDSHFQYLLQIPMKEISKVQSSNLLSLVKSLYSLGLEKNSHELRSVEQEVRWRLRRLPLWQMASLASFMVTHTQKGKQIELLNDVVKNLELRWIEIEGPKTVAMLMTKVGPLSESLMDRLEDKALELAEQFSLWDIRNSLMALALQNRRSIPLLRALSYYLIQKHFVLNVNVLVDLAFAYAKLDFHQTQVFQKLASDLLPHVPKMDHSDMVRCARSFAHLRWLNLPLFEAFAQHAMENADKFSVVQMCNLILAFAYLNFQPSKQEVFYHMVHAKLEGQLDTLDTHLLIDVVWSLCVLQQVKATHLQAVLTPQCHSHLLDDQSLQGQNYKLKLLHINATAQLECANYQGPFLSMSALSAVEQMMGGKKPTPLQISLQEELKKVAGDPSNVCFDVNTVYGWILDAEMVLSSSNKLLPVKNLIAPHLPHAGGALPLPQGTRRLVFLRWEYPNFSSQSKDLLGRFVMAQRHLQAAGFLIIDVPYYEWLPLKSEWQKAAYLKDKMRKVMAVEMARYTRAQGDS
uniref:FAST kinase domain-containing protein 4 n=1 Tax=Sphenodon punctatus TaxID=8508 RepID=A0A8D0HLT7_SPHPU